ncbi:hypothetical protein JCM8097_008606 [Rhodosporidiobolus ruineniae]
MALRVRQRAGTTSTNTASRSTRNTKPDYLSSLPAELLHRIFDHVYAKPSQPAKLADGPAVLTSSPTFGPISKRLLPFQRCQYTCLRLFLDDYDEGIRPLVSQCDHLTALFCRTVPTLPKVLSALPHPDHLQYLSIDDFDQDYGVGDKLAPSVARLTSLYKLVLNCPVELADRSLRQALRSSNLKYLELGEACLDWVSSSEIAELLEGADAIPSLRFLEVNVVHGHCGEGVESFLHPNWPIQRAWEFPEWPSYFSEHDMKEIVKIGKREGVEVFGTAVDAIGLAKDYVTMLRALNG